MEGQREHGTVWFVEEGTLKVKCPTSFETILRNGLKRLPLVLGPVNRHEIFGRFWGAF